jgi:hypothetical protein
MADWYDYPTNFSNGSEINGMGSLFKYINYVESGWLGYASILVIWVVVFGFSLLAGSRKAMATASFVSFIFATYFTILGMLNPAIPIMLIVLTIVGSIGSKQEY